MIMKKKKKFTFEEISGNVFNLGSEKKNISSARRFLTNKNFKGKFIIKVSKTPKTKRGIFVKFKATRKIK